MVTVAVAMAVEAAVTRAVRGSRGMKVRRILRGGRTAKVSGVT